MSPVRTRSRFLAGLTLTAALLAGTATPAAAAPIVLTSGHVDVIDVDYAGGALAVNVLDDTVTPSVERNPADVVLRVPTAAKLTVPGGSAWSFLGTGGQAWVLPQSNTAGLLWAGWNTTEVPSGVFQNNRVTFKLTNVSGPAGFSIYTVSGGTPTVLFDSGNGLPDSLNVNRNTHAHVNWGFDAAGTYAVTFEVTGKLASNGSTITSGPKTFTFEVLA
ncbi:MULTISPECIES: choice-of-anchor M domain-containing protein [unclassified Micromonospora]|uniref:choice-of-anchor M domain-containing protein n=1 Tax=unclassified Micromonospora TaxID=2617518 RepID=UPI0022B5EC31|nr:MULTISPECIES: choice-of-anchor M domain-containing protein [unclassified Micromonospora]MCZ7418667.1 choice-of-anchor M domain-containing protein [Verrucosispora sp. WMMA2121]WBB92369.1 choice-of-anchor M domain-containing protein [Verrucosispora sp. WMMC514]